MASSKIKGINIKIGADTTGLDTALKKIESSGKSTTTELREIERSLKINNDSVVLWTQKQELLTKAIEKSKEKTNLLEQAQKGIEQAYKDGDIDKQAYDKFHEKLKKATEKLNDLKSQQEDLKNKLASGEIGQEAYDKFVEKVKKAEQEVQGLENSQRSMEENMRLKIVSEEQYRAFQREIESSRRETERFESQLSEATNHLHELENQSDETADDVDELGDEMQESGEQAEKSANGGYSVLGNVFANVITEGIKLAGQALKNFTEDVVATGMEYESAISNVVAISGAMAEEVEMLQAKAEEMGATTKFTAAESAEAMSYMAMAGWKVNDMISGLDGIMDLSAASGESLSTTSDIVTDALTAFGLAASDSGHFADVLAAASSNANTNVAMMGETFKYAAPLAGTLKYSIEDMALATGLMANSGIKASQAGTTLNAALARLSKPTKEMKSYMQQLGLVTMQTFESTAGPKAIDKAMRVVEDRTLSAENAQIRLNQAIEKYGENSAQALTATNNLTKAQNSLEEAQEALADLQNGETVSVIDKNLLLTDEEGNLKSLRETIDTLRDAFSGLSEIEQAEAATAIFGKNSMAGMLAVVNAKAEDYNKLAEAVDNADGAAKGMASTMMDNLQGDKTLLESAVDGMKISISKELTPALRELVQYATSQVPKVQKVIEPMFKSAVEGAKKVIQALPDIIDNAKKLTPVVTGISTAIGIIGVSKLAENLTNKLIPAVKLAYSAISAHPLLAVLVAVEAVTAGVMSYLNAQLDEKTALEELTEKHNAELQAILDKKNAIEDLNNSFYENVGGIQNQTDRTRELWQELDKLSDQYGNVQQKDKARAEYILNELNSALGTEYTMTGNQIDNYRTLAGEIDNVIEKKKAEMLMDAYLANANDMTESRRTAKSDYETADKDYQEKQKIVDELEQKYKELTGNSADEITKETDKDKAFEKIDYITTNLYGGKREISDLAKQVWSARDEAMQAEILRKTARKTYESTSEYFDNLDKLQEAYSLGQYDRMADIVYAEKDLTSTTLDESATDAEKRLEAYSESLQKTLSDFKLAVNDMKQTSVDELEKELNNTMHNALLANQDPLEVWKQFRGDFDKFQAEGLDITGLLSWGADSGIPIRDVLGRNGQWRDIIQSQLDAGFDITNLLKWCKNSNYTASMVLGDKFMDYLQEQLDKGADISYLLEWGSESGEEVSEEFTGVFTKFVQKQIDEGYYIGELLDWAKRTGIDLSEAFGGEYMTKAQQIVDRGFDLYDLIQWAESAGINVGTLFGENFQDYVQRYANFQEVTDVMNKTGGIVSESVGRIARALGVLPKMADGGFLHNGQAIVAEAGPELIEVMNGGAKVTPLSRSAQNTPVSNGGQKIFYSTYTINATISGGYDVSRLAEELETERRRIENGRGM